MDIIETLTPTQAYAKGKAQGWAEARNREYAHWMAERVAEDKCAVMVGWCITHNTEANVGHSFDHGGVSTLD